MLLASGQPQWHGQPICWQGTSFPVSGLCWLMTWRGWGHWPDSERFLTFFFPFHHFASKLCLTFSTKLSSGVASHRARSMACDPGAGGMSAPVSATEGAKARPRSVFLLPFLSPLLPFFWHRKISRVCCKVLADPLPTSAVLMDFTKALFCLAATATFHGGWKQVKLTVLDRSFIAVGCSGHRYL